MTALTGSVADESFDTEDSEAVAATSSANINQCGPLSLQELSVHSVARHCSCSELEKHTPPLDERLLRRVGFVLYLCKMCVVTE